MVCLPPNHVTINVARFAQVAAVGGGYDDPRAVDGGATRRVAPGEPAGGRAAGAAGGGRAAGGPGLPGGADRGDPRLRGGRGAHLAAPLRAGGGRGAGGRAPQRAAADGPAGAPRRRRPGGPAAGVLGARPSLLDG